MKRRMMLVAFLVLALLSLELPTPAQAAPPANDDFDHAEVITSLPYTVNLDTTEATWNTDDPQHCMGGRLEATVWYAYTPASDARLRAKLDPSFDSALSVWTGTRDALTFVNCSELMAPVVFDVYAGQTYYLMIGGLGWGGPTSGLAEFTLVQLPPPPNDDFDQAIPVSPLPFSDTQDISTATVASDDPETCWWESPGSIWYKFSPSENGMVLVRLTSTYWIGGGGINVFTGSRGDLSRLNCGQDALRLSVTAGETYYFMIHSIYGLNPWDSAVLTFSVDPIVPPVNDDIANAIDITALPFADSRDITGATFTPDDAAGCGYAPAGNVWYKYTATSNKRIQMTTVGSNFEASVNVYTGAPGSLQNVTCWGERIRLDVVAGQTYYFAVTFPSDYALLRNLVFMVQDAPPYLAIDLTIDRHGSVNPQTKVATLHGTVQCNQQATGWLYGSVTQRVGRAYIKGYFNTPFSCSGSGSVAWSSLIYSDQVPPGGTGKASTSFLAGSVTVEARADAYTWEWYESAGDSAAGRVTLANSH